MGIICTCLHTRKHCGLWAVLALTMVLAVTAAMPAVKPLAMPAQAQEELVSPSDGWRRGWLDGAGFEGSSIALNAAGLPRVSYVGYGADLTLKFASYNPASGWSIETVPGVVLNQQAVSLSLQADGQPGHRGPQRRWLCSTSTATAAAGTWKPWPARPASAANG